MSAPTFKDKTFSLFGGKSKFSKEYHFDLDILKTVRLCDQLVRYLTFLAAKINIFISGRNNLIVTKMLAHFKHG